MKANLIETTYEKMWPFCEVKMKGMQKKYLDAQAHLKMDWRNATSLIDGRYIMLDGVPVGEMGWKWWILKVMRHANIRERKRLDKSIKF